jgi:hypothetical protein
MTLDAGSLDVAEAFYFGQVYVAFSRVRSLEHSVLKSFDATKIKTHPKVLRFYEHLEEARAEAEKPKQMEGQTKCNG